jgi:putative phage-type endonuclease
VSDVKPLGVLVPGTPEWLAARKDRLGGSEVAAALGLSPWCSPFTLWHRKRGLVGPGEETQSMYWGKKSEPMILAEYKDRHGVAWLDYPCTSYANDWRIAAPDARADDELVEIKTADKNDAWEWGDDGSDDPTAIPPYYRVQCLWYSDLLNEHRMSLAVLIGGNDYREYVVPWDQAEADDIRKRAAAFHRTVVENIRPDLDSSTSTYQTVRELHPDIDGETVEVPAEIVHNFLTTDVLLKNAKTDAQLAKTRMLDAMGTARIATLTGEPVARRQPGRNGSISLYPLHSKEDQ